MRIIRALGRVLLLGLIRLLYPVSAGLGSTIDRQGARRILVIRTDTRVGNVLLTTPLVRALRLGLPQARVDFLVAAGKEALVQGLADRVLPFAKKDLFRHPFRFWRFLSSLRRERYDVVVEAGHWHAFSFTSLWLAQWTRAPVRIGHARGMADRFLTHCVRRDPAVEREVLAKLELLGPLGVPGRGEHLETTVDGDPKVTQAVESIVRGCPSRVVALNPGARKPNHRWPSSAFGKLAWQLRERLGVTPLVLWGPGEEGIARQVIEASRGAAVLAPPTDLAVLSGVFRRSAAVVTNDTGPMHLAAAAGARIVAVLMVEDGPRWCHGAGVPVRSGSDAEVEQVAAAVEQALTGVGGI